MSAKTNLTKGEGRKQLASIKSMQTIGSQMTFNTQDYQEFFAKNQAKHFGIASYVMTGTKIQAKQKVEKKKLKKSQSKEVNIQTENADTLTESDIILNEDLEDLSPDKDIDFAQTFERSKDPNLIFQGAYVKVLRPKKEEKPRPMSAFVGGNAHFRS